MNRHELARGSKGLWQRIEALVRSTLPRQARVTRTEGRSVWVKFLGDGADDPEARFPSTVAEPPIATMGWVITLGGKKGLFVATGIHRPQANSNGATVSMSISTSGEYPVTAAAATVSGLAPGSVRRVVGSVSIRAIAIPSGMAYMGMQVITEGQTSFFYPGSTVVSPSSEGVHVYAFTYSASRTVGSDGTVTVVPCIRWSSGTVSVSGAYATIQVI